MEAIADILSQQTFVAEVSHRLLNYFVNAENEEMVGSS